MMLHMRKQKCFQWNSIQYLQMWHDGRDLKPERFHQFLNKSKCDCVGLRVLAWWYDVKTCYHHYQCFFLKNIFQTRWINKTVKYVRFRVLVTLTIILSKRSKSKLKVLKSKCIRLCLNLNNMVHIDIAARVVYIWMMYLNQMVNTIKLLEQLW